MTCREANIKTATQSTLAVQSFPLVFMMHNEIDKRRVRHTHMAEILTSFHFRYSLYLSAFRFDGELQASFTVTPL